MLNIDSSQQATDVVESLLAAPAISLGAALRKMDADLRIPSSSTATKLGHAAVEPLVASTVSAPADKLPYVVMLLGLLAQTDARDTISEHMDSILKLFAVARDDHRLAACLLFLVGEFRENAQTVIAAATDLGPSVDDLSRLQRRLADRPARPILARVWPSPAMWAVSNEEHEADQQLWGGMSDEFVVAMWDKDTRALRDFSGAKAVALLDEPAAKYSSAPDYSPAQDVVADNSSRRQAPSHDSEIMDLLKPFSATLACPDCGHALQLGISGGRCGSCEVAYPVSSDFIDLSSTAGEGFDAMILNDAPAPFRYERGLRPGFLRVMGRDFSGKLQVADEIDYLKGSIEKSDGQVLDLAAGSGKFTRILRDMVGPERLIAVDLSTSMLSLLQSTGPRMAAVRASALRLPFLDESFSAVVCWNALQTLPEKQNVLAEVARVLKPSGAFTLFTFTPDADPIYREFQARQEEALRVQLHTSQEIEQWLNGVGLRVVDERKINGYLFQTSVNKGW